MALIEKYGPDSVRVGLLLSSAAGNDLLFDEALCQQGEFANRFGIHRLIQSWMLMILWRRPNRQMSLEWYRVSSKMSFSERPLYKIQDFRCINVYLQIGGMTFAHGY